MEINYILRTGTQKLTKLHCKVLVFTVIQTLTHMMVNNYSETEPCKKCMKMLAGMKQGDQAKKNSFAPFDKA